MTVLLALPAYNEEQGLPKLFRGFRDAMGAANLRARVVIVDDGSKDHTREVIREWSSKLSIDLILHGENRGLGETIRDALKCAAALAEPDDTIVTMDADNTHDPVLIPSMIRLLGAGKDVVIASRYRPGSRVVGLEPHRRLVSYGARMLFQIVHPISGVRDYTCGFRAYRARAVKDAFARHGDALITERGFACMAELLLRLSRMGLQMGEVPMVLRYDQKEGASKMKVARTVLKTLRLMARSRFTS